MHDPQTFTTPYEFTLEAEPHPIATLNAQGDPHLQAQLIIEQILGMAEPERSKVIAEVFGVSAEQAERMSVIKGLDGKLSMQLMDPKAAIHIKAMKAQGFEKVAFQNRKQRRAAKAQARRA